MSDVYRSQRIVLLHLDNYGILHEIHSIDTDLRPITLSGNIALSNEPTMSPRRWSTIGRQMKLSSLWPPTLVVCALSITLYNSTFTHITTHPFGWVDGASAIPTSILICCESDNPSASELNPLEIYSVSSFPPTLISKVSSRCGALRCTDVILGKWTTTVWIRPHDHAIVSLGGTRQLRDAHLSCLPRSAQPQSRSPCSRGLQERAQ